MGFKILFLEEDDFKQPLDNLIQKINPMSWDDIRKSHIKKLWHEKNSLN